MSDGFVAFKSNRTWSVSKEDTDTMYIEDKMFCEQTLESKDSLTSILLFSGRSEAHDVRIHNQVLPRFFGNIEEDVAETLFTDTIADDKRLIATQFKTLNGDDERSFTVATIFHLESPKSIVLASTVKGKDDLAWLKEIFESIRWDLKSIADTKHEKDGGDKKDDVTGRTGNGNKQSDADMLAGFFYRRTPSFLFGEMLLEHHKREIAYSQGCHPLY